MGIIVNRFYKLKNERIFGVSEYKSESNQRLNSRMVTSVNSLVHVDWCTNNEAFQLGLLDQDWHSCSAYINDNLTDEATADTLSCWGWNDYYRFYQDSAYRLFHHLGWCKCLLVVNSEKFQTNISFQLFQMLYLLIAITLDIMRFFHLKTTKAEHFNQILFWSLVFPFVLISNILFWPLYFWDKNLIAKPVIMDKFTISQLIALHGINLVPLVSEPLFEDKNQVDYQKCNLYLTYVLLLYFLS